MRLNVRCCCQPAKILGTLEVPMAEPGSFSIAVLGGMPPVVLCGSPTAVSYETHEIKIREFGQFGRYERAVYSDDRGIEFWRKIPGFIEGEEIAS